MDFDNVGSEEVLEPPHWADRAAFAFYAVAVVVCVYLIFVGVLARVVP